jgi:7-carboxy-7-deazaguanine synthase
MQINLVKNGIFPIVKNADGSPIADIPDTGYAISGTVQGEGKLIGMPCLFIRTSACNLRCAWIGVDGKGSPCDTPYSSHKPEKNPMEVLDIVKLIQVNQGTIKHIIISGGEPTMQTEALGELLETLQAAGFHTTIETNATIYDDKIAKFTNLFSMSPKLSSSTPHEANLAGTKIKYDPKWADRHERDRKNIKVIQDYINACHTTSLVYDKAKMQYGQVTADMTFETKRGDRRPGKDFQLKFVVTRPEDILEIENDFLAHLTGWKPEDICLMPEGITPEDLMTRTSWVVQECVKRGWRFTPRLHALLFGVKRGV